MMVISKKIGFFLVFLTFPPNFIMISKKHIPQNKTISGYSRGVPKIEGGSSKKREARVNSPICLTQYPPLIMLKIYCFHFDLCSSCGTEKTAVAHNWAMAHQLKTPGLHRVAG